MAIASWLGGCNQPAVSLKPPAFQSSENTIRDWTDVARAVADGMAGQGLLPVAVPGQTVIWPSPRVFFVRVQAPDSTFLRMVGDELEREILRRGGVIARMPTGATVVNLDVDFVQWGPRDKPPGLLATGAGVLTIPAAVIGASQPMSAWTAAGAAGVTAVGVGVLSDTVLAMTPTMNAEAIWKATLLEDNRVVMRLQQPIYIRSNDIPLYAKANTLSPISSDRANSTLQPRTLRYDR